MTSNNNRSDNNDILLLTIHEYDEDPTTCSNSNDEGGLSTADTAAAGGGSPTKQFVRLYNVISSTNTKESSSNSVSSSSSSSVQVIAASASNYITSNSTVVSNYKNNNINSYQNPTAILNPILQIIKNLFLPIGYPNTVREGYLEYQIYDSIQGLCSYLRGVLCTAAVFEAVGVGTTDTSAVAAAITWAQKDGMALCGGLFFSYHAARYFDAHVKEFRLFADISNDIGFLFDMIAPLVDRNYLLGITSAAVLCKTMCGIAAGATKSSITAHFAIAGNMADLNAKESTQETAVNLLGMIFGIYIAKILHKQQQETNTVGSTNSSNWILFWIFTILHIVANWKGVTILRLRTLNRARLDYIIEPIIEQTTTSSTTKVSGIVVKIPTPEETYESLVQSAMYILSSRNINVTTSLPSILRHGQPADEVSKISTILRNEKYLLFIQSNRTVYIVLKIGATTSDELKSYINAKIVRQFLVQQISSNNTFNMIQDSYTIVQSLFVSEQEGTTKDNNIIHKLDQAGWHGFNENDTSSNRLYLGFPRKRYNWKDTTTTTTTTNVGTTDETKKKV